ncbi:hypothetical protein [Paeniglutamicibacter sulfureus]|uniref:DUF2339 domain-containing protein n=1 Tax=Paeniglutamicibacter sulfureus TaxID=43666 RepID=A0ABU2BMG2_9MICC|nr:hypothetical protein [Paeniglutamicibacter sulfureus]MDR7359829.1 hypothetical protein [Paeniglutamicibacter sulfureus]
METFVLVVLAVLVFLAGFFLGKRLTTRDAIARNLTADASTERKRLAEAWQLGFEAATLAAEPVVPSSVPHREAGSPVGPEAEALPDPAGAQPLAPGAASGPDPVNAAAPMRTAAPEYVPPVPVDPRVRALRNINITLYVAALLMVASASLFIALALPAPAKVVGLGIVALGFYVAGLVMHAQSERLRPAAAAFTATGLALVPMTGLAHYLLLSQTPGASWFVTSVVGTAAFVYAAARLQSKVIAGLSTTFLVSIAYSGGAVLNRGLVYYFLFSMLLATAITLVGFLRPRWITNIYVQSFTVAHRYLVPATLLAAVLSAAVLEAADYAWLFAAAAVYYSVALVAAPDAERFRHLAAARAAGMLALGAFLQVAEVTWTNIFRVMAAVLLVQFVLLAHRARIYSRKARVHPRHVTVETWVLVAAAAMCTVLGAEGLLRETAGPGVGPGLDLNWALALLVLAGLVAGAKPGGHYRWIPLGAAVFSFAEPTGGNLGRQGIVIAVAVLGTWMLARRASGSQRLLLRWAARAASIVAAAALFGFAAAGWVPGPGSAGNAGSGSGSGDPVALAGAIEVASMVGVILAVLVQAGWAVAALHKGTPAVAVARAEGTARIHALGESMVFAGSVACASATLWLLEVNTGVGGPADLDAAVVGWSTRFWLGSPWVLILMWLLLAVGLVGATLVLGHRRAASPAPETIAGGKPAAGSAGPPAAGVPAALMHLGGLIALGTGLGIGADLNPSWLVELVAVFGLAYVGIRIVAGASVRTRVGYSVLAQVLFSGAAWHVADRFTMDGHGQYALLAFTIALGQAVRALLSRSSQAVKPGDPRSLLGVAALVLLLAIPAIYLAGATRGLDQASLLVQCLCLAVFAGVLVKTQAGKVPGFRYAFLPAALGFLGLVLTPARGADLRNGGWLPSALWGENTASTVLVLLVVGILAGELRALGGAEYRWVRAGVALMYWVALAGLQDRTEPGWQVVAGLLGAAGATVFAATWGVPLLLLGTAALVLLASLRGVEFMHALAGAPGSEPLDTMIGLGATFVVLLVMALFGGRFGGEPVEFSAVARRGAGWGPAHARVLLTAGLAALGSGGLLGLADNLDRYVYAGGAMLLVAVFAAAALEVPARRRETGFEVAALVAAAVIHRCWWVAVDGTSAFAATFYWVITLGLLAVYEFSRKREREATVVLGASAALLSVAGLGTILSSNLGQQLLVLLGFTILLVSGLLSNRKIFTVWGAVGVAVAVLWFLRGFTFLLLLLVAAGLIALALWKLGKMNRGSQSPQAPAPGQPPAGPAGTMGEYPQDPTAPSGVAGWWTEPGRVAPAPTQSPEPGTPAADQQRQVNRQGQGRLAPQPGSGMPWMKQSNQDTTDEPG